MLGNIEYSYQHFLMQWIKTGQAETAVIGRWTSVPRWGPLSRARGLPGAHRTRDRAGSDVGCGRCVSAWLGMGSPLHMEVSPAQDGWEAESDMGPDCCFIPWLPVGDDQLVGNTGNRGSPNGTWKVTSGCPFAVWEGHCLWPWWPCSSNHWRDSPDSSWIFSLKYMYYT